MTDGALPPSGQWMRLTNAITGALACLAAGLRAGAGRNLVLPLALCALTGLVAGVLVVITRLPLRGRHWLYQLALGTVPGLAAGLLLGSIWWRVP